MRTSLTPKQRHRRFLFLFILKNILWGLFFIPHLFMYITHISRTLLWKCTFAWGGFTKKHLAQVGITSTFKGLDKLPAHGRYIIASNHQSTWETFVPSFCLPRRLAFVAKKELFLIPFLGWYLSVLMIVIDRKEGRKSLKKMIDKSKKILKDGHPIFIFPQGTRCKPGEFLPFLPGVYFLAKQLNLPVYPAALNSGQFWPKGGKLYPGEITFQLLDPIWVDDLGPQRIHEKTRDAGQNRSR